MPPLSRNAQVLRYLAEQVGPVGATKHLKLAYLADLTAREYLGEPVSDFEYIWYDNGPFDSAFYQAREELELAGLGREDRKRFPDGKEKRTFRNAERPVEYEFSPAERHVLDFIAESFGEAPLTRLLGFVYDTEPMNQTSEEGDPLPMDIVDDLGKVESGFDLAGVLEARHQAEDGDYDTLEDFARGLRAEITG